MKTIVVDIDETLFKSGKISYCLRFVAKLLFKLSLMLQKPNREIISKLSEYDRVIVLTARGESYRQLTEKQLRRSRIKYDSLIMCDYITLTFEWKKKIVEKISPSAWVDDIKGRFVGVEGY